MNLASIGNIAYESLWYTRPIEMRKELILTIRQSQQPFNFTGLGIYRCNLETFAVVNQHILVFASIFRLMNVFLFQILRRICSYYVMICKMGEK